MTPVDLLFNGIDEALAGGDLKRFSLQLVGSTALFAQTSWARGTRDCDAVRTWAFDGALAERLLALAGPGRPIALHAGLYLELVGQGVLFLPGEPRWKKWRSLRSFDVEVLHPVDVAVAKLARLNPNDLDDIEALVERNVLTHRQLLDRFRDAAQASAARGMAHKLPLAIRNLHRVERDIFLEAPSPVEVDGWASE
jgi:hypothetical protein